MASHRSTDSAPADDQAFAESFDETKARTKADQRAPMATRPMTVPFL